MEVGSSLSLMPEATPLYQIRLAVRRELSDLTAGDAVIVAFQRYFIEGLTMGADKG